MVTEDGEPESVAVEEQVVLAQRYTKRPTSQLKPQHRAQQFNSRKRVKREETLSTRTSLIEEPTAAKRTNR